MLPLSKKLRYSDRCETYSWINARQIQSLSEWALSGELLLAPLNQRVPGSSPGAPTKSFNSLGGSLQGHFRQANPRRVQAQDRLHRRVREQPAQVRQWPRQQDA